MGIGHYGLENPHPYSVNKFSQDESYIVCFGDKNDEITIGNYKVVHGSDEAAVLHRTQNEIVELENDYMKKRTELKTDKYKCIRVTPDEAIGLDNDLIDIIPLGYLKVFEEDSLVIFTGQDHQSELNNMEIHSRKKAVRCLSENDLIPIHIDLGSSQVNFDVVFKDQSVGIRSLDPERVTNLKVEENNWLELSMDVDNLGATMIDLDGTIQDIKAELIH